MALTYEPISTTTLGSAQSSVTFSSITGIYTDLVLVITGSVVSGGALELRVGNGSVDTGSNYSRTNLYGTGSSGVSNRDSNQDRTYTAFGSNSVSTRGMVTFNFQNYANTTTNKVIISRWSELTVNSGTSIHLWRSAAAINTITITGYSSNFIAGSTFTLYGIKAA